MLDAAGETRRTRDAADRFPGPSGGLGRGCFPSHRELVICREVGDIVILRDCCDEETPRRAVFSGAGSDSRLASHLAGKAFPQPPHKICTCGALILYFMSLYKVSPEISEIFTQHASNSVKPTQG